VGGIAGLIDDGQARHQTGSAGTPGSLLGLLAALMGSLFVLCATGVGLLRSMR
jgi:hypothetical protein